MIATDADCIPAWKIFGAVAEHIGDKAHRVLRWIDISTACSIFFQNIILYRTREFAYLGPLLFSHSNIEREQDASRSINGHRRTNAFEWQAVEECFHIFQTGNRNANLANFAF